MVETLFFQIYLVSWNTLSLQGPDQKQWTAYGKSEGMWLTTQLGQIHFLLSTLAKRGAEAASCQILRIYWLSLAYSDLALERGEIHSGLFLGRSSHGLE